MATTKTLNAKNLEALGSAKLAELLIEVSTGNAVAQRRLRLELARSSRYKQAARHLSEAKAIAPGIEEFGSAPPHDIYMRRIRCEHGRKTGFWQTIADRAE